MKIVKTTAKLILLAFLVYLRMSPEWKVVSEIHHTLPVLINFLIFYLAANQLVRILSFYYRKRKGLVVNAKDNVLTGLENLYYINLAGAVLITVLGLWGIDFKTLFTSLSIVAAAIAIISKDYLAEIISGIIISFSNEISINDYVKIGENKGTVLDFKLTKIAILNEDDNVVYLPNNKVFVSEIVNYTKRQIHRVNVDFEIDIKFLKTIEELEEDLINCLKDYQEYITPDKFNLRVVSINRETLNLQFQFQLLKVDREREREVRKKTVRQVINYIKAANLPAEPTS